MKVPDWVLRLLLRELAERGAKAAAEDLQLYPGENFGSLARWAMLELSAGITHNEDDDLLAALLQPYVTELGGEAPSAEVRPVIRLMRR